MKKKKLLVAACLMAGAFAVTSCGNGNDPFASCGFNAFDQGQMKDRLAAYTQKDVMPAAESDGTMRVYIDFSDGMVNAYKGNSNNLEMIKALANKFTTKADFKKLAGGQIQDMDFSFNEIFNKVVDPRSYSTEIMAPIEEAVKTITEGNDESLLVTDFEEYTTDKKEQFRGFAEQYFEEWIKKGNSITFYVANFVEKRIDKHLYFIVFNTPQNKLKTLVEQAWAGRNLDYETFDLTTNFYTFETNYPAANKGGEYFNEDGYSIVFGTNAEYYVNASEKNYEYYPCQASWADIFNNSKALMEQGVKKPFTHLFRNLFVNFKNTDSYNVESLAVKVSDVTEDFDFFSKCNEAKNHPMKMDKDASGNVIVAADNDEIALTCYDANGELRSEWKYSPKSVNAVADALVLDEELFNNTKNENPEKTEIGIKYHNNFNGTQLTDGRLIRIDVVINKCEPNIEALSSLFTWQSITQKGKTNNSLEESVRNTIQSLNPDGKVVYTYYVKTF